MREKVSILLVSIYKNQYLMIIKKRKILIKAVSPVQSLQIEIENLLIFIFQINYIHVTVV